MLQPKRTKYRKQFKGHNGGLALRGSTVAFGDYGLKAVERARMTARAIWPGGTMASVVASPLPMSSSSAR